MFRWILLGFMLEMYLDREPFLEYLLCSTFGFGRIKDGLWEILADHIQDACDFQCAG